MNPRETAEMTTLINRLRNEMGLTVLLIEHDMRVVMGISDWITVLDHGERIAEGTPAEVRANPQGHRGISGHAARRVTNRSRPGRNGGDRMTAQTTAASAASTTNGDTATPMLRLDDIQTYYGRIQALKGVTLEIAQGEIVTCWGRMARARRPPCARSADCSIRALARSSSKATTSPMSPPTSW